MAKLMPAGTNPVQHSSFKMKHPWVDLRVDSTLAEINAAFGDAEMRTFFLPTRTGVPCQRMQRLGSREDAWEGLQERDYEHPHRRGPRQYVIMSA